MTYIYNTKQKQTNFRQEETIVKENSLASCTRNKIVPYFCPPFLLRNNQQKTGSRYLQRSEKGRSKGEINLVKIYIMQIVLV